MTHDAQIDTGKNLNRQLGMMDGGRENPFFFNHKLKLPVERNREKDTIANEK
jgi:hypothetical protein